MYLVKKQGAVKYPEKNWKLDIDDNSNIIKQLLTFLRYGIQPCPLALWDEKSLYEPSQKSVNV